MGVCAPINHNKWTIVGGVVRSAIVLTTMSVCVFQPCIRYFLRNLSNLVDATGVGLMVSIGLFAAVSLISFSLQQTQVHDTLLRFQSSVQKCMYLNFEQQQQQRLCGMCALIEAISISFFHFRSSSRYLGCPIETSICKCRPAKWLVYETHNWRIAWFCLFIDFDGIDNNFGRFISKGYRPWGLDAAIQSNVKCHSKSLSLFLSQWYRHEYTHTPAHRHTR